MKSLLVKGVIGTIGASGLVVGGYYGFKATKKEETPKVSKTKNKATTGTVWEELQKDYDKFSDNEWQTKFDEFRKGDKSGNLSTLLNKDRTSGDTILVSKDQDNQNGGEALKGLCEVLFNYGDNVKSEEDIENAKSFCVKPKAPSTSRSGE